MILFEDFEYDHTGPPVGGTVALQSRLVGQVAVGAERTVGFLTLQGPFDPCLGLLFQSIVVEDVG